MRIACLFAAVLVSFVPAVQAQQFNGKIWTAKNPAPFDDGVLRITVELPEEAFAPFTLPNGKVKTEKRDVFDEQKGEWVKKSVPVPLETFTESYVHPDGKAVRTTTSGGYILERGVNAWFEWQETRTSTSKVPAYNLMICVPNKDAKSTIGIDKRLKANFNGLKPYAENLAVGTDIMIEHFEVKLIEYTYQGGGKYGPKLFLGDEPSEKEIEKEKLKKFGEEESDGEEKSEPEDDK